MKKSIIYILIATFIASYIGVLIGMAGGTDMTVKPADSQESSVILENIRQRLAAFHCHNVLKKTAVTEDGSLRILFDQTQVPAGFDLNCILTCPPIQFHARFVVDAPDSAESSPQTIKLAMNHSDSESDSSSEPSNESYVVSATPALTTADLESVEMSRDDSGKPVISFTIRDAAAQRFQELTSTHLDQRLAITTQLPPTTDTATGEEQIIFMPLIRSAMSNKGMITGNFSDDFAQRLTVGMTLAIAGIDSIPDGVFKPSEQ